MRKVVTPTNGKIKRENVTYEGESIEQMIAKRMNGNEIEIGGKALLYTDRKDGVLPETNIRSDRFDIAMMALDAVERARIARREAADKVGKTDKDVSNTDKSAESTQGTDNN